MGQNKLFNYHMPLEKLYSMLSEYIAFLGKKINATITRDKSGNIERQTTTVKLLDTFNMSGKNTNVEDNLVFIFVSDKKIDLDINSIMQEVRAQATGDESEIKREVDRKLGECYFDALKNEIVGTAQILDNNLQGIINQCYVIDRYLEDNGKSLENDEDKMLEVLAEYEKTLQDEDAEKYPQGGTLGTN